MTILMTQLMTQLELSIIIAALRDDIRNKRLPSDTTKTLKQLLSLLEMPEIKKALEDYLHGQKDKKITS